MKLPVRGMLVLFLVSGLLSAFHSTAEVLIDEIMYHPSTENVSEEYIELYNHSPGNVDLSGWRFSKGVEFTFPSVTLAPGGYLVVAADLGAFTNKYPGVTNVIGNWTGRLSNRREDLNLDDAAGNRVDSVEYADEGDWALREHRAPDIYHYRGWTWHAGHDGNGSSLELINPDLSNNYGQNWASSLTTNGTPGRANSVLQTNIAPLILEVQHLPPVPRSTDSVLVTARLLDERGSDIAASLRWRVDGDSVFASGPMFDDGLHDDGGPGDSVFTARIPAQSNNAVVEFYLEATDLDGRTRTWPAPAIETNGVVLGQLANALYQVDDSPGTASAPLYKLIMEEAERAELAQIGSSPFPGPANSDAEMNGTFVSIDATGTTVSYATGIRNRGHYSRNRKPNNYRVNFPSDKPWKGVTAINLNAQYTHLQLLGAVMCLKSGLVGGDCRPVQVRVNNANLANNGPQTYGGMYVANEVVNSDWADHWFPQDSGGNIYRAVRDIAPPNFNYRGTNWTSYTNTYFKESNVSENDWTDLIALLEAMGEDRAGLFSTERARSVADVEQWLLHLAVVNLMGNGESGLNTGNNDDYRMYHGRTDPRFILMYYDLDQLFGQDGALATDSSIFRATGSPISGDSQGTWHAMNTFMHWPEFERIYYRTLQHLLDTSFSESEFNTTVDQTLGDFVPASVIDSLKTWMNGRRAFVQSVITPYLATNPVAPMATVSGEPRSPTPLRDAVLTVGGAGVTQYRYSLNGSAFGPVTPVATPIVLAGLPGGSTNTVLVTGAGTNGVWQETANATVSRSWVVDPAWPAIRINEVLARNVAAFNHSGTFPDAIELYNEGSATIDLSGYRLTDKITSPNKFTIPNGTALAPGSCLVVLANDNDGTPGLHAGFSLDQDGEGVFLFDKVANGERLLDSVEFGQQLADYSIGRVGAAGEFVLTQPSLGTSNIAQPLTDPRELKINEWLASEFALSANDFIELYNPGALPAGLGRLYLTDNPIGEMTKHRLPPLTFIAGRSYRVFKADGNPGRGIDHLDFKLNSDQGMIALLTADRQMIDCILYGPQRTDVSQGRSPDGSNFISSFLQPSPGAPNPAPAPPPQTLEVLPLANVWRYQQTANLDGINWTAPTYDDSAWPQGAALLYYESATLPGPKNTPLLLYYQGTRILTYYFRTHFTITNDPAQLVLRLWPVVDDGAVFYLNGRRIYSLRLPDTDPILYADLASTVDNAVLEGPFSVPTDSLVQGDNVLAVEVHQTSSTSSDVVFGLRLDAVLVPPAPAAGVVVNEVLANNHSFTNSVGRTTDWVELYNPGTNSFDLGDLSLTDNPGEPRKWVFPSDTMLGPHAYLVIEFDDNLPLSATNTGFGLNTAGDAVYLFKRPSDGGDALESVAFGLQVPDLSIARVPNANGDWSLALPTRAEPNVAAGFGNASFLRINEWLANPSTGEDWLELYNPNPQPVALSGLALTDDATTRDKSPFPPLTFLAPGSRQTIVADDNRGQGADHAGFKLDANGDFIGLYWPDGVQIDAIAFGPMVVDVSQGRFPDGAAATVEFVRSASPGAPNYLPLTNVVVNEVLSHTDPPLEDAVEVQNLGPDPADISGWYLSNNGQELRKFIVPAGTILAPGGFKVFYEYQFGTNTSPDSAVPFNFNSAHGDEVHLAQTDAGGQPTGYRASAKFGAAANGVSFGRFVTSVGEEFTAMSRRSFGVDNPDNLGQFRAGTGATNPYPLVGPVVFNLINFHPTNGYNANPNAGEFLELRNITSNTVALYDPAATSNTWHIAGGVDYLFPTNVRLLPGVSALVVGFDPAADPAQSNWFCTEYQVPATVRMFGPWSGALANEGEELDLLKPDPPQLPPHPDAGFVPYIRVEHVRYLPTAPWPASGIGTGAALFRVAPKSFANEPLNWIALRPRPGVVATDDTDGDGLPDYWENEHALLPDSAAGLDGADGDPDGDGESNAREFLAGTDPQDAGDYLHIEDVRVSVDGVTIRFRASASRSHSVFYSDGSPAGPWHKLADAAASANPAMVEVTDPNPGALPRFYRLVTAATSDP